MKREDIRSDLAVESLEELTEGSHYHRKRYVEDEVEVEIYEILKKHPSINQDVGTYVEITFEDYLQQEAIIKQVAKVLNGFINQLHYPRILIVGLGNQYLTSDAIGPRSVRDIRVTHFMDDEEKLEKRYLDVLALAPGVMVQTGMESSDIIKAVVDKENIELVIVIDALCAKNYSKLSHVIQVNNVGLNPGGGIGNHRKGINKEILGIDVIAIGVPTVIYASSLVNQVLNTTLDYFGDSINPENKLKVGRRKRYVGKLSKQQKTAMLGELGSLDEQQMETLFNEVLNPIGSNYVLSDKQIDEQCEVVSKIIAKSINSLRY
ncbi:MAG: GPR endopeptidase [Coprobacillaceae bacterium]